MDFRKKFLIPPGGKIKLAKIDPRDRTPRRKSRCNTGSTHRLCAEGKRSLLIGLQRAPWYVIPSNHKWFRDLAIWSIRVDTRSSPNDIADWDRFQAERRFRGLQVHLLERERLKLHS
jgi:hypothetical protein